MRRLLLPLLALPLVLLAVLAADPPKLVFEKKATPEETLVASLKASGLPTLEGQWHFIGPFDNSGQEGFDAVYPPEKEIDLSKSYPGKGGQQVGWKEFPRFRVGAINNLGVFPKSGESCVYLVHDFEVKEAIDLKAWFGSDDTITVWVNGKRLLAENVYRPAAPDQNDATLKLQAGKNRLLIKVCNGGGDFQLFVRPAFSGGQDGTFLSQLNKDFPSQPYGKTGGTAKAASPAKSTPEGNHYRIVTLPVPKEAVLEVGGLAFRPDGKLLACTRRGDVWLVENPTSEDLDKIKFKLFASGLHEALGLRVEGKDVYVVQRPELTKLSDRDGDDVAEAFECFCDKWGCSGDYHEFAFGLPRDKDGNFYVTLNVGFGGGDAKKSPFRGWCVKVTPKGELIPFACGLRSPNGLSFSPDGDLFYCDNQGEWVATGKMHHIREGEWYGHPVSLKWVKSSPFAGKFPEKYDSGMLFDGQPGPKGEKGGMPPLTPPVIQFPYGRMGQSQSEPIWDTTGGKFGPFAGQCFVGDQCTSVIMRVDLEKVNGRYQGACFPFRSGFECGVNRLCFAADGSLMVGMTARGWGSRGGKPWGLQRLVYTGTLPFEVRTMHLMPDGFELTFTKPLDAATARKLEAYNLASFTYNYWGTYGSPEVDRKAEKVTAVNVAADGKSAMIAVPGLKRGRVYELHLEGVKSSEGDPLLHAEAYYTLNDLKTP